jgi:uncharacterized membrane-anchored protein
MAEDAASNLHAQPEGTARVDRRTKDLLKRIEPGEIAVIAENLDRIAADGLVEAGCSRW